MIKTFFWLPNACIACINFTQNTCYNPFYIKKFIIIKLVNPN